ncbi:MULTISPECIES: hypothetical protein [Arthrobacter]|uniref:Uncharacterized protein n=1 Tax=Arthrobacter jinronghuae TaxID=2964609 RepID=A0ABT1NRZ7_9MICC|nr:MULTISPECIES: hypothetical protein [Arthrobacter]MCQ1949331.1 hypothetical protein [Arthrobacter jinronghuae]MCQ1952652.1 hypothetical protein [Arthrobacter sp. zg-Y238]MCQ1955225.1 hypothetical protein [Arthrobacter jinronghuae]UWX77890.1 hypothetical protein N2K98_13030 [Arthrobacter jinronghuae]
METETNYWAFFAIVFPFGLLLFVGGILVYRKIFVGMIVLDGFFPGKPSLASTYLGAWLMLVSALHFVPDNEAVSVPYTLLMFACQGIGMLGWLWMPKFMQPEWMKEVDRLMARGEDRFTREFLNGEGKS